MARSGLSFPSERILPEGHSFDLQRARNVLLICEFRGHWGAFTAIENKITGIHAEKMAYTVSAIKFSSLALSDFHHQSFELPVEKW